MLVEYGIILFYLDLSILQIEFVEFGVAIWFDKSSYGEKQDGDHI